MSAKGKCFSKARAAMNEDEAFMRMAIAAARRGIAAGQTPFGACVVKDGRAVVCAHNQVFRNTDITAHAEIVAIRRACRLLGTVTLEGCAIYSTTEPCPMCFSACHWARIDRIVYGTAIRDALKAGFNELTVSCRRLGRLGGSRIAVEGGVLRAEALHLFEEWRSRPDSQSY